MWASSPVWGWSMKKASSQERLDVGCQLEGSEDRAHVWRQFDMEVQSEQPEEDIYKVRVARHGLSEPVCVCVCVSHMENQTPNRMKKASTHVSSPTLMQ